MNEKMNSSQFAGHSTENGKKISYNMRLLMSCFSVLNIKLSKDSDSEIMAARDFEILNLDIKCKGTD